MSYWNENIVIGNRTFPRFIGGPLDGITDSPFRKVIRNFSSQELLFTEMRHVASVAHEKAGTRSLDFSQMERPLNFQVSANKVDFIEQACERIIEAGVDCVDLNIGCPARLVVNSGAGSALMADLPRLKLILESFRKALPVPFTLKMRAGYKVKNAVEVAQLAQDCGVDALSLHPRLQTQFFLGVPDYELAAQVKKAVSIPLILSGGIINWSLAKSLYEQTGVDGFLIGRGIWSRPWKLHELYENSQGRLYKVSQEIIRDSALTHLDNMITYYGQRGVAAFRKHLPFYIKGKPHASELRQRLITTQDAQEVKEGLKLFFEE